MRTARWIYRLPILFLLIGLFSLGASAQTTAFSYQGSLTDNGTAANGSYQFRFRLFDAVSGGAQIGPTIADVQLAVSAGIFSTKLDFGASPLSGANRFLEIAIRRNAGESYVTLTPREQITSSPYAVRTLSAAQAEMAADSQKLGGVNASEYITSNSLGNSVIRNQATLQSPANFNISGNGAIGGNLGVGTPTPNTRLSLAGGPTWTSNAWTAAMNLQNASALGWEANASGQRFGIGQSSGGLYFFRTASAFGSSASAANYHLVLTDSGNVGVGTTTPTSKIEIAAQNGLAITGFQPFLTLRDTNAANKRGVIQTSDGGLNFYPNNFIGGSPAVVLRENGNVSQTASAYGLPKAMVLVRNNGLGNLPTFERCYNAVTGSTTGNCGFTIAQPGGGGVIYIRFTFRVTDRYMALTPIYNSTLDSYAHIVGFDSADIAGQTLKVLAEGYGSAEADFYLIVF